MGYPRVAVLLQEYIGQSESDANVATQAVTQVLLNVGYKVVDLPQAPPKDEDPVETAKHVNHAHAELLIDGLARAQRMPIDQKGQAGMVVLSRQFEFPHY